MQFLSGLNEQCTHVKSVAYGPYITHIQDLFLCVSARDNFLEMSYRVKQFG